MKGLIALLLWSLPTLLLAQAAGRTFTSRDGAFRFQYPGFLTRCTAGRREGGSPGGWTPAASCAAYFPVCDNPAGKTLVCFAYPKSAFKSDLAFGAAAFSVAEIAKATTEPQCFTRSPDADVDSAQSGKTVEINHTAFLSFAISDAGMSHLLAGKIYRGFHGNTCYELAIRMASTNPAVFDPPARTFTARDKEKVMDALMQALNSFTFLK